MQNSKRIVLVLLMCITGMVTRAQQDSGRTKLYNPAADVEKELQAVMAKAAAEKKHILVQVGGNWCSWCIKFHKYAEDEKTVKGLIDNNYVVYLLNYSPENKNLPFLAKMGYPQRFGFPVFLVLDAKGNRLHTQDSGLLELGATYNKQKVVDFLTNWTPAAISADGNKNW
jgi:thiol:disulfide interchange protein